MATTQQPLDSKEAGIGLPLEVTSTKSTDVKNEHGDPVEAVRDWTAEEEKAIVRKIDFRVFPMLCVVFGLSLLDRANISAAYIAKMSTDLVLTGSRYNIALLVFFIGYGLFELPSNAVIRRLGARWWLSFLIVSWGFCVFGMGFVQDWRMLTLCRALLGVFEAGLFPGSVYIIASWYRQYETAKRISLFYMASLVATAFGPIIAYALSLIRAGDGMFRQGWRWIFIVEGAITVVAGIIAPIFLVEFPERVKFLNQRQKYIALERLRIQNENMTVVHPSPKQIFKMLLDWKLMLYAILYFIAASGAYSVAYFFPIILREGMGFEYAKAQLLSSPPYMFAIICSITAAWISDKIRLRWPISCFQSLVAVVGLLITLYAKPPGVRYFGLFIASYGVGAAVPTTLTYGQNQTARQEKKGVVAAAMITVGAAGGVCGSTIFRPQDKPLYLPGMWATIAMFMLHGIITFCLSMYFKRQNRLADETGKVLEGVEGFRYAP